MPRGDLAQGRHILPALRGGALTARREGAARVRRFAEADAARAAGGRAAAYLRVGDRYGAQQQLRVGMDGMTDQFACMKFSEFFVPVSWQLREY